MAVGDREHIALDGEIRHMSEKAILFWVEALDEEIWFPLSQVEISQDQSSILVPRWLARAKGL